MNGRRASSELHGSSKEVSLREKAIVAAISNANQGDRYMAHLDIGTSKLRKEWEEYRDEMKKMVIDPLRAIFQWTMIRRRHASLGFAHLPLTNIRPVKGEVVFVDLKQWEQERYDRIALQLPGRHKHFIVRERRILREPYATAYSYWSPSAPTPSAVQRVIEDVKAVLEEDKEKPGEPFISHMRERYYRQPFLSSRAGKQGELLKGKTSKQGERVQSLPFEDEPLTDDEAFTAATAEFGRGDRSLPPWVVKYATKWMRSIHLILAEEFYFMVAEEGSSAWQLVYRARRTKGEDEEERKANRPKLPAFPDQLSIRWAERVFGACMVDSSGASLRRAKHWSSSASSSGVSADTTGPSSAHAGPHRKELVDDYDDSNEEEERQKRYSEACEKAARQFTASFRRVEESRLRPTSRRTEIAAVTRPGRELCQEVAEHRSARYDEIEGCRRRRRWKDRVLGNTEPVDRLGEREEAYATRQKREWQLMQELDQSDHPLCRRRKGKGRSIVIYSVLMIDGVLFHSSLNQLPARFVLPTLPMFRGGEVETLVGQYFGAGEKHMRAARDVGDDGYRTVSEVEANVIFDLLDSSWSRRYDQIEQRRRLRRYFVYKTHGEMCCCTSP
ncbi:hypothetical protein IAU59_002032 [Kwoniella sp. CBS 9459]